MRTFTHGNTSAIGRPDQRHELKWSFLLDVRYMQLLTGVPRKNARKYMFAQYACANERADTPVVLLRPSTERNKAPPECSLVCRSTRRRQCKCHDIIHQCSPETRKRKKKKKRRRRRKRCRHDSRRQMMWTRTMRHPLVFTSWRTCGETYVG